jgi:O-antigen/teichoic acid export membrane protein
MSNGVLAGLGLVRPSLVAGAVAAAVNVALAFVLIPAYDATGAALANTGAQITIALGIFGYTWKLAGAAPIDLPAIARPAIASALAGAIAWLILSALEGLPGVALGTVAGVAVFALAGRLLGVLRDDDAQWLWNVSGERALGRLVRPACRVLAGTAASEGRA